MAEASWTGAPLAGGAVPATGIGDTAICPCHQAVRRSSDWAETQIAEGESAGQRLLTCLAGAADLPWTGEAADAFRGSVADIGRLCSQMEAGLDSMRACLLGRVEP